MMVQMGANADLLALLRACKDEPFDVSAAFLSDLIQRDVTTVVPER